MYHAAHRGSPPTQAARHSYSAAYQQGPACSGSGTMCFVSTVCVHGAQEESFPRDALGLYRASEDEVPSSPKSRCIMLAHV